MNWSSWIRRFHRWMSIAFMAAVVATAVALAQKAPVIWMSYVPLLPLALLFITGLYMLVQHYAARWRTPRRAEG